MSYSRFSVTKLCSNNCLEHFQPIVTKEEKPSGLYGYFVHLYGHFLVTQAKIAEYKVCIKFVFSNMASTLSLPMVPKSCFLFAMSLDGGYLWLMLIF